MQARSVVGPVLALLLAASGATECEVAPTPPKKSCDFRPKLNVHRGVIVGKAKAVCDVPPDIHNFELWLAVLNESNEWRVLNHTSSTRIPGKRKGVTLKVRASCEEGEYRVEGKARGVLEENNFTFKDFDVKHFTEGDCQMG